VRWIRCSFTDHGMVFVIATSAIALTLANLLSLSDP